MSNPIRIVIADDHPIVRTGLRRVIEGEPDFEVVAEAGDGETGLELIRKLQPHVAILDLDMPKLNGFEVAGEIRRSNLSVEVIFLTIHREVDLLHKAMDIGGRGYIVKQSALVDIVDGIRSVAARRSYVSPSMTAALLQRRARTQALEETRKGLNDLTPSERRILSMIAMGKATAQSLLNFLFTSAPSRATAKISPTNSS